MEYRKIEQIASQLKQCLIDGFPFIFGLQIYKSFEDPIVSATGIVKTPVIETEEHLGGHALMCVGFDEDKRIFIIRNSWGEKWGQKGYCEIPYDYILNPKLAADFWTLTRIENSK